MELDVRPRATHEVVNKADNTIALQGSGQKCADFMFELKGEGVFTRHIYLI